MNLTSAKADTDNSLKEQGALNEVNLRDQAGQAAN